jgi:uncharacterized protein
VFADSIVLYLVSFVIIVLAVTGMAVGVIFGRPAIKGSCGGIAGECPHCTRECRRRKNPT